LFQLGESFQLETNQEGIEPGRDGENSFADQSAQANARLSLRPNFCGDGQQQQIREKNSINGGYESSGDACAHLLNVIEMLHDLDEADGGARHAKGRGIPRSGFVKGGGAIRLRGESFYIRVEQSFDGFFSDSIHGQTQGFAKKGIFNLFGVVFERNNASGSGGASQSDKRFDDLPVLILGSAEHQWEHAQRKFRLRQRHADEHRTGCACEYDEGGRQLADVIPLDAFGAHAEAKGGSGQEYARYRSEIGSCCDFHP
jgi:hypothetical protein